MQIILSIILDDSHLFRFLPTTKAAHGWNGVLSSFDSIWSVLWSPFPLPCYVCHCSRWVCCARWFNLFFSFDLYVSLHSLQLQHIRLTLVRGAGRKTGAKRSSGSLPPSYIIFVTMQWCGSTRGESTWCIYFHFQLLKAQLAVIMLLFAILCLCATPLPSHRFKTRVTSFTTVEGHEGSKMLILKMKRPSLFMFQPGQ